MSKINEAAEVKETAAEVKETADENKTDTAPAVKNDGRNGKPRRIRSETRSSSTAVCRYCSRSYL